MRAELLSPAKLKIIFDNTDLEKHDINYKTLSYKNKRTREFFWEAIHTAKQDIGFDPEDSKLLVEAFPEREGGLLLYVTKLHIDREAETRQENKYEYSIVFDGITDFLDCADFMGSSDLRIIKSPLYLHNDKYVLNLTIKTTTSAEKLRTAALIYSLCEYGELDDTITHPYLSEHAEQITKNSLVSIFR